MKNKYDVIIVGTGVAGCFAALHLPSDMDVLMITKGDLEESDSFLAQGGICVLKNDDDYDSFFEDTMKAGHYENSPESVDFMINGSQNVINELIEYGVEFEMESGGLSYTREGAHSTNRILYHEDITGQEITGKLLMQVKKRNNIKIAIHTVMVDILCGKSGCDGVLIKNSENELEAIFADNIMWACGGIGGIYNSSTNFAHLTGDALAISLKRDIKLKNISYIQIHPTTLFSKNHDRRFLISESVRGEGAQLYDKNGNRFVDELQPRDVVSKAILKQMKKDGTEHVWLSFMTIENVDIKKRFPNIYSKCLQEGYDITKEWIPVVPAQHYFMGGVEVDLNSHTSMEHLYAAGETCCNGVHGANRLASNSLLESLVFAESAAKHMVLSHDDISWKRFKDKLDLPLSELADVYNLDLDEYADLDKYTEKNKRQVLEAIDKDKKESA
ncbi:MAG: L-aspartate oxidase [Anaerovoracaceae bacterium]